MAGRSRVVLLTLLALAAPAYAISDDAYNQLTATPGPAAISVSTSLDSCGILDDGIVCKLDVSFNSIPNADSYSATVTRADGSVIDYGSVGPGGTSLWVPYVGAGNYSVKITAYGEPESADDKDGKGEVIATGHSRGLDDDDDENRDDERDNRDAEEPSVEADATDREPEAPENPDAEGAPTTEVGSSAATTPAPAPTCTTPTEPAPAPPVPPEEPPADADPANPDEDADGIPDDQERVTYDQQMAEYQAAVAAQQAAPAEPAC
jgi:hypothetical protein